MKRLLAGTAAAAALLLTGCASGPQPVTSTQSAPTKTSGGNYQAPPTVTRTYSADDWRLEIDTLRKQCFGSAGCNVTFQIEPTWISLDPIPTTGSIRVTYLVTGAESDVIGTFETSGQKATIREHIVSTENESDELSVTATKVVYNP